MRKQTSFERDFRDLHGRRPRETEFIRQEDVRSGRLVTRIDQTGTRLVLGALGLFWSIILLGVLVVMLVVGWAFVSALFDPAPLFPA